MSRSSQRAAADRAQCAIDGCAEFARARGWCGAHYQRWRRFGDPNALALPHRKETDSSRRTANGTAYFTDEGRAFQLRRGVGGSIRRVYGEVRVCEGCKEEFLARKFRGAWGRFCSTRCEKRGERNPMRRNMRRRGTVAKHTADHWFSRIVRSKGSCERCGGIASLQCAHVFSRLYLSTRWDEDNALCLCSGCHMFFTHHPIEWEDYIIGRMGEAAYYALRRRAATPQKPDYESLLDHLTDRMSDMGLNV